MVRENPESIRQLSRRHAIVQVLVTVKASPEPSSKYGDTVCVAGTLMSPGPPKWIRLYPVPFRYMSGGQQFKKYDIIEVRLNEATQDQRPESAKIDASSVRVIDHLSGWGERAPWVEPLVDLTMCDLQRGARADGDAQSLGSIRPLEVNEHLDFEPHGPWSPKQQAVLAKAIAEIPLFGAPTAAKLQPPRLEVRLRFTCRSPNCKGHKLRIIDWELTALQLHGSRLSDSDLESSITDKFMRQMFLRGTDPIIYVGNQHDIRKRKAFTILGVYYPKTRQRAEPTLF